jgi:hypothetical protein
VLTGSAGVSIKKSYSLPWLFGKLAADSKEPLMDHTAGFLFNKAFLTFLQALKA